MGAGDLITASVSGANYGYNLMWLLVLSLLIRFVICNIMGRFQIYNNEGHLIVAQMIKGSGIALNWMFGFGSDFIWSVIVVLVSLLIMGRNVYKKLEWVMKGLLAILTVSFIGLAVYSKPDVVGILKGT
ncbi:hypothetical protein RhiirA1_405815, partial [Rhizophagus irregularis]